MFSVHLREPYRVRGPGLASRCVFLRRLGFQRDVHVDARVHPAQQPVQHSLFVAHLAFVFHAPETVFVVNRLPHVRAVVPRIPFRVQLQVHVLHGVVHGPVAAVPAALAHVQPEFGPVLGALAVVP